MPQPGDAEIAQLRALFTSRRYPEAEARARQMIQAWPAHEAGWQVLAMVLGAGKRHAEALPVLLELQRRWPAEPETYVNLGNTLRILGKPVDAANAYAHALKIRPDLLAVHYNLAETLRGLGRMAEAEQSYRRTVELDPAHYAAWGNLGNTLLAQGRRDEAEACMRRTVALQPGLAAGHAALANVLRDLGRLEESAVSCRRALELEPGNYDSLNNLGNVLYDQARYPEAIAQYQLALQAKPDYHHAYNNLGNAFHALGKLEEAERCLRRAVEIKPDYYEAHNNLARTLLIQAKPHDAVASCRLALQIRPDYENAFSNMGNALLHLGDLAGAAASFRRALELKPDFQLANSILLFCLSHMEDMDAATLLAEHRAYAARYEAPLLQRRRPHANTKDPERKLQVGFLSGDFRGHAVSFFLEPVLAALAGYPGLELHAYSNHPVEDAATQRMRGHVAHWARVDGLTEPELAARIQSDGIDILIDLSGHTGQNRMIALAHKPAPLQATWIGYPGTTGLEAMDYYLADRHFLPHRLFDAQFVEKIVHLPAYAAFQPLAEAPAVSPLPALRNGHFTFGSFNRLTKISPAAVQLWSKLLLAVPGSRMVLAALPGASSFPVLAGHFARAGVPPERLSFHAHGEMKRYLELHAQVDLCLDTVAYTGGTTTLHALWMGVPTLTIEGKLPARRLGAVIARHAGLEEFVARDAEDFVRKGLHWAGNAKELQALRASMRKRFAASPMGQPALVAAGLENALRTMWRQWCAGKPAKAFTVR